MSAARSESGSVLSHALKDALLAGIVAFGLFILLLGFLTEDSRGPLQLIRRPGLLASAVGAVFAGRFIVSLIYYNFEAIRTGLGALWDAIVRFCHLYKWWLVAAFLAAAALRIYFVPQSWPLMLLIVSATLIGLRSGLSAALLVIALVFPVAFYNNPYFLGIAIIILTYIMLGWGLNIVVGLAGLLDLGYVAFYAVGAIPTRSLRRLTAGRSGCACRLRVCSRPSSESYWDFPYCGCAATILRS